MLKLYKPSYLFSKSITTFSDAFSKDDDTVTLHLSVTSALNHVWIPSVIAFLHDSTSSKTGKIIGIDFESMYSLILFGHEVDSQTEVFIQSYRNEKCLINSSSSFPKKFITPFTVLMLFICAAVTFAS